MANLIDSGGITPQDTLTAAKTGVTNVNAAGPFSGLLFILGIGGLMVVASENQVAAAVAQGILIVALLLLLISLLNGKTGAAIFTG